MLHCAASKNQFAKGNLPGENVSCVLFNMLHISAFFCINLLWNYLSDYPCFYFVWCLFKQSHKCISISCYSQLGIKSRYFQETKYRESVLHLQAGVRHFEWRRRIKLAPDMGAEYQPCVFEVSICKPFPIDPLQSEFCTYKHNNIGIIW